ncbi:MAG: histone deacetylase [Rhodobacteraceae bacterium]|nr:histone deacetylase [Paracoccaceae bacterium]
MSLPIVHHPDYQAPLRADHRFPMSKYGYLRDALVARGLLRPGLYVAPGPASPEMLALAHNRDYVDRALSLQLTEAEVRRIGLPMTERIFRRGRLAAAGSALAGRLALRHGLACNSAGGSHHAGPEGGAGFCTFNDVGVAILTLRAQGLATRVLVVDCDAHQGDGTADIFAEDPAVFTLSLHGEKNYPFRKAVSDLDIGLEDGVEDTAYLDSLTEALGRAMAAGPYDLAFYNAGVDVHADDRLGRLSLSDDGLRRRDRLVLETLRDAGTPVAGVIGGGYDDQPERLASRHAILFEEAARLL